MTSLRKTRFTKKLHEKVTRNIWQSYRYEKMYNRSL